jgi:hypothetical protein
MPGFASICFGATLSRYHGVDRELIGLEKHSFQFVLRKSRCLLGKIGEGVPSGRA